MLLLGAYAVINTSSGACLGCVGVFVAVSCETQRSIAIRIPQAIQQNIKVRGACPILHDHMALLCLLRLLRSNAELLCRSFEATELVSLED